jgi:hypothetical protein
VIGLLLSLAGLLGAAAAAAPESKVAVTPPPVASAAARELVASMRAVSTAPTDATRMDGAGLVSPGGRRALLGPPSAIAFDVVAGAITPRFAAGSNPRVAVRLSPVAAAFRLASREGGLVLGVRTAGRHAPAEVVDGYVVYRGRSGTGDVVHRVSADGTEDFVRFAQAPSVSRLEYDVQLEAGVAGLRLVEGVLEFLDAGGAPRLRVAAPFVVAADGVAHPAGLAVSGCAVDTDPRGPWGRQPTPPGADRCAIIVSWGALAYPAVVDPLWTYTGDMVVGRFGHTLTLLATGKVLAAGGLAVDSTLPIDWRTELWDPTTSTWSLTGSLAEARNDHTATLLGDGRVLVAGGSNAAVQEATYDAATGTWSSVPRMAERRIRHTATVLASGEVLVTGGFILWGSAWTNPTEHAERFDPTTNTWSNVGSLATPRALHAAALLASGEVLVAGGTTSQYVSGEYYGSTGLASTEMFDPTTGAWSSLPAMANARWRPQLTRLESGVVLATGGFATNPVDGLKYALAATEIFDPTASSWGAGPTLHDGHLRHTATLLLSGKVLLAGNDSIASGWSPLPSADQAEVLDVASGTSRDVGRTSGEQFYPYGPGLAAVRLADGRVLVAGGGSAASRRANALVFGFQQPGQPCTEARECESGFCAAGVCCTTACDRQCATCAQALGAPADGTCGTAAAGTPCREVEAYLCDGASTWCSFVSCTDDDQCSPAAYCRLQDGQCFLKNGLGGPCLRARYCESGNCANGRCCDAMCAGQCATCDQNGENCTAITGFPGAGSEPCSAAAPCTAMCDGSDRYACSCVTCADGYLTTHRCQGTAACTEGDAAACGGGFACQDAVSCGSTCTSNEQCVAGYGCAGDGTCLPQEGSTCDGDHTVTAADRVTITDCTPYRCEIGASGGVCKVLCATTTDCASGYVCDVMQGSGVCTSSGPDVPQPSGGCAVARAACVDPAAPLAVLALLGLGAHRRGARRSSPRR